MTSRWKQIRQLWYVCVDDERTKTKGSITVARNSINANAVIMPSDADACSQISSLPMAKARVS
jgi:hypothetical protein